MTNPRIYWTRDFCCWLPAPPLRWGSTKQNTLSLAVRQSIIWRSYVDFNRHNGRQTHKKSPVGFYLRWVNSFLYFYRIPNLFFSPHPFLNNPALPNTPEHIFFLFVKMVRYTVYFKLGNTGYYLNKINRDSSVSIGTWVSIEWWGDRILNSSSKRSLSPVIASKPPSCLLRS